MNARYEAKTRHEYISKREESLKHKCFQFYAWKHFLVQIYVFESDALFVISAQN